MVPSDRVPASTPQRARACSRTAATGHYQVPLEIDAIVTRDLRRAGLSRESGSLYGGPIASAASSCGRAGPPDSTAVRAIVGLAAAATSTVASSSTPRPAREPSVAPSTSNRRIDSGAAL